MKNQKENKSINGASAASSAQSTNQYTQFTQYNKKQGHGWAAEDANAMTDRLRGKHVDQVGRDNHHNGADRISNGVQIQTKYCASARESVNAAFSNGAYRYDGMKLEVPKDQYEEAVKIMAEKIRSGQVTGVSDPAVAKYIVIKGNCTYQQAKNIAKAGNIDSIKFDMKTQSITCGFTCGISFVLSYADAIHNGCSHEEALKAASKQAAKSGATAMAVGVGTQQLLRTTMGRTAAASATKASRTIVSAMSKTQVGQKVVTHIGKSALERGMRTNIVTGTVMFAAQTIPDAIKVCKGKMSGGQFCENAATNAAGIGGGYAGATAGAAIGTLICPTGGSIVGGIIGGVVGGIASSKAVKKACSIFH